jgi:hypothetical protein
VSAAKAALRVATRRHKKHKKEAKDLASLQIEKFLSGFWRVFVLEGR